MYVSSEQNIRSEVECGDLQLAVVWPDPEALGLAKFSSGQAHAIPSKLKEWGRRNEDRLPILSLIGSHNRQLDISEL